jgi:geranylgeranyl diphosphate synthase type II
MRDVQSNRADPRAAECTPADEWAAWFDRQRDCVDAAICDHLAGLRAGESEHARTLFDSIEYSTAAGGKRARPILVLESCRVCGGDESLAMPAAIAVECIHAFSLIHDDLPAMDDDDLRRGRSTNHRVFGEATAILAGDWLVPHAFGLLVSNPLPSPAVQDMIRTLSSATMDMVAGQAADIGGEGRAADKRMVEFIHRHKTASLIEASCRLGALVAEAEAPDLDRLGQFGHHLGLAFQIADDVLDRTSTTDRLGKRAGKDEADAKQTYPAAFGMDAAIERAAAEARRATDALSCFGPRADRLRELAAFVIRRDR